MALTLERTLVPPTQVERLGFKPPCVVVPHTGGHPFTADVTILQNKASLLAIMKGGSFHKPPTATLQ